MVLHRPLVANMVRQRVKVSGRVTKTSAEATNPREEDVTSDSYFFLLFFGLTLINKLKGNDSHDSWWNV